jgi:anion-transporting  ArsA/GET3 family ATPase
VRAESARLARGDVTSPFGVAPQRLWIVTGKGGTGKTTLAAALAALAARAGERVLLVNAHGDGALPALLEVMEPDAANHEIAPGLHALFPRPEDSLAEYIDLQLPIAGMGKRLLASRAFAAFLDAAPGWRDLVMLGKLWQLEQQRERGRMRFDRIVVDAPSTGHGLSLLTTPQSVLDAIRVGPLHRRVAKIHDLIVDARRTRCIVVTLAEELPARETLELASALRRVPVALGPTLVNRCEPELRADPAALARLPGRGAPPLVRRRALAAVLSFRARRCAEQRHWIETLEREISAPVLRVPELSEPIVGLSGVNRLADALACTLPEASA